MTSNGEGNLTRQRTISRHPEQLDEEHGLVNPPTDDYPSEKLPTNRHSFVPHTEELYDFWDRFTRKGKKNIGFVQSCKAIASSSLLNLFLVFIPIAWVAHFEHWSGRTTFTLCFLAIIPLERLFDYGGEQMCYYVGKDLGDLIVVTLNNAVEATLAIILLLKCEFRLLQSTIAGVVLLHLLLIPGTSFIIGGVRIESQDLHPHLTELNHVLLTMGVLTLLLPSAFFAALNRGVGAAGAAAEGTVSNETREIFLRMSRGLAIILLVVYICSRIYLHNPPGEDNALRPHRLAPEALKEEEKHLLQHDPEVNQYVCLTMLIIAIAIMAATAEWLVESIEFVREAGGIGEEWFGLVLLPIVSFSADGAVAVLFFIRYIIRHLFHEPPPPATLAKARAIDLSIQFTLFWMPFIMLLSWWTHRTFSLLFDFFEVAILIGSCFLVNYVTADAKTNWAEGVVMVSFYAMIVLCAWWYEGQPEINELLGACGEVLLGGATAAAEHR